jgi:hypothetical protein
MSTEIRAHLIIDGIEHPEWCGEGESFSQAVNNISHVGGEGESKTFLELLEEQPNNTIKAVAFEVGTPRRRVFGRDEIVEIICD